MQNNHRVIRGGLNNARIQNILISGISAGLSFYSLSLIGSKYGASQGSDAYFYLISVLTLLSGIVTSLFGTIFLPQFVALKMNRGVDGASEFASCIFTWSTLIFVLIGIVAYCQYVAFFGLLSKFSYMQLRDIKYVLGYFSPLLLVTVLAEFFRVNGLALGKFLQCAISGLFQPLLLVIDLVFFSSKYNEESLAISLLASRVLVCLLMVWTVVGVEKIRIKFTIRPNKDLKIFAINSIPYGGANIVTIFANFFFDYMASGLSTGTLTALSFAQRIAALPVVLLVNPILDIARTQFAVVQAKKDQEGMAQEYKNILILLLYICIPIAFLFIALPDLVVSVVFQRGVFTAQNTMIAANALSIYGLSLIFSCIFLLNGRFVESYQNLLWPSFFGVVGNVLLIGVSYLLVAKVGYIGIPLSRLLIDVIYFLPFGFIAVGFFNRKIKSQLINKNIIHIFLVSLFCILLVKYVFFGFFEIYFQSKLIFSAVLFLAYFSSICVIYFLTYMMKKRKVKDYENII